MSNVNLSSYYKKFEVASTNAFSSIQSNVQTSKLSGSSVNRLKNSKAALIGGVVVLLLVAFLLGKLFAGPTGNQASAPKPQATQTLNKDFHFPLKDGSGKTVSNITYTIQSANLQDSFIYQGKLAEAVKGRTFLIFNLKITNPYTKTIQINARDYIRVRLNGTDEQLAPEIHNDPVEIDAKATKYTRVGLPINTSDKDIQMLVGEINGSKQTIKLSLER